MKDSELYFKLTYIDDKTTIKIQANNLKELIEQQELLSNIQDVTTHITYRGVDEI